MGLKRILATLLLLTLAVAPPGPASAGIDEGAAAYNQGNYATALREFRPLADQREAIAQYNLGVMYGKGQGVPRDYAEAIKCFREAAEQGKAGSREGSNSYEHNQTARRLPVRITSV